jgi:hypothetical protein
MERYAKDELRWLMSVWPTRRVFRYKLAKAHAILHNFGNERREKWRIGSCDERGNVRTWSVSHYSSVDGVLEALNQA